MYLADKKIEDSKFSLIYIKHPDKPLNMQEKDECDKQLARHSNWTPALMESAGSRADRLLSLGQVKLRKQIGTRSNQSAQSINLGHSRFPPSIA